MCSYKHSNISTLKDSITTNMACLDSTEVAKFIRAF